MGPEKLDNTVYFIRGLYDLADMAQRQARPRDANAGRAAWPTSCARGSTRSGGTTASRQYADSLSATNERIQQKHWIGVTPMEIELTDDGETVPGLAPADHGDHRAGRARDAVLQRRRARSTRASSTPAAAAARTARASGSIFSLNTAIQAVGEGNYGRSAAAARYTDANVGADVPARRAAGRAARDPAVDRTRTRTSTAAGRAARWSCRPGATTAPRGRSSTSSSACGRRWARAGSTSCRRCRTGQPSVAGRNIRLGDGSVDVAATARSTTVSVRTRLRELRIGLTLKSPPRPREARRPHGPQAGRARTNRGSR